MIFSYDVIVIRLHVLTSFFDGLAYLCVFYSLFMVAVFLILLAFRHQGSSW